MSLKSCINSPRNTTNNIPIKKPNGIGIKKSMEYQSKNSGRPHLGMQINRKRLELLSKKYGTPASIIYTESLPGNSNPGTIATVIVPFTYTVSET